MAKKKLKAPPAFVSYLILGLIVVALLIGAYRVVSDWFVRLEYFKVKSIMIERPLKFIDKRDLIQLKGKSIFTVDLSAVEKKLKRKYPQMTQLKVVRRFPSVIAIQAKRRLPFAQTIMQKRVITLDDRGLVLLVESRPNPEFPFIVNEQASLQKFNLGAQVKNVNIQTALKIIKGFHEDESFDNIRIEKINVENLSKVSLFLSNGLEVIMDRDRMSDKFKMLNFMLTQNQINLQEVRYIDLRFKEPILGKKVNQK